MLAVFSGICKGTNCQHSMTTVGVKDLGEQGMAQWWECSPPTNVARGSTPGVDAICGLSLLLVLSLALRGFSPGTPVFPSPQKPTLPNSNLIWNAWTRLNEFIWTPRCFMGKQAIYNFFYDVLNTERTQGHTKNCNHFSRAFQGPH